MARLFMLFAALRVSFARGFVSPRSQTSGLAPVAASQQDVGAPSGRLGSPEIVASLFYIDGQPRQFLKRPQFIANLVASEGPALSEEAAYECWLAFGGAPKPEVKKKEDKGFFGNFAASIAENAAGTKDKRAKDEWGNPIDGMLIIGPETINAEDAAAQGWSVAAMKTFLEGASG